MNKKRISHDDLPKGFLDGLMKTGYYVRTCGLDRTLQELINHRVSQINGCAYCLDMHHKNAIHNGETEQRLHGLSAWRETPYYSEKERAALAFAEAVTAAHVPSQQLMNDLEQHFSDAEIANLGMAVIAINSF